MIYKTIYLSSYWEMKPGIVNKKLWTEIVSFIDRALEATK